MLISELLRIVWMASRPLVALMTSASWFSRSEVSAKMLRASSSTTSTLRPRSTSLELCRPCSTRCMDSGRSATTRCRNSAVSSSRPLRRAHILEDDALGQGAELAAAPRHSVPCRCRPPPGRPPAAGSAWIFSSSSKPLMSGRRRSSTTQSKDRACISASAAAPGVHRHHVDVLIAEQGLESTVARSDCPRRSAAAWFGAW